jgi:hypothetical protein
VAVTYLTRRWRSYIVFVNFEKSMRGCRRTDFVRKVKDTLYVVAYCKKETCVIVAGARGNVTSPLLTVHKVKNALLVDANIFDKDGNLIEKIERNKTFVNRNFVSDFNRPEMT